MMAAVTAAGQGRSVLLVEQNPMLGKKLRITGKGRCNVTNDCEPAEFLKHVVSGEKFLYGCIYRFPPSSTKAYFESLGVPLKTERGRRVFPVSDRAADIAEAMTGDLRARGVRTVRARATGLMTAEGPNGPRACGVRTDRGDIAAAAVILATGGVSYPATGSRGDGHRMAADTGHTVTALSPSLVAVETAEDLSDLMGLTLKNVTLRVDAPGGKKVFEEQGELLFTHFGVSGPLVLSASAHMQEAPVGTYRMTLDLKPALDEKTLDARLISDLRKYAARDFCNALDDLLPKTLIPEIVSRSGIPPRCKAGEVTRDMRRALLSALKGMTLQPAGFRPMAEAIVTHGGVSLKEVDPKTMMSRRVENLFFAGELLDADAYTGGYNLQIAFATGRAAGAGAAAAAESLKERKENTDMSKIRIAIDGPSGSGKSSLAKNLSRELRLVYVDTGAMYRTVGLAVRRAEADPHDEAAVAPLLEGLTLEMKQTDEGQKMFLNGEDVTGLIRTEEMSRYASAVGTLPAVRRFLTSMQKRMAEAGGIVMDGRDIGTVVIPDAEIKIFLKTSPEERARRRLEEQLARGEECTYEEVLADIRRRDEQDTNRASAPLRCAEDAVVIDNSGYEMEDTLREALGIVRSRLGLRGGERTARG